MPDVFVPDFRMGLDVSGEKRGALLGIKIDHLHAERTKPVNATLKRPALTNDERGKTELADEAAAVPAGRERGHHNEIAIAALAARTTKRVGLRMHRGIALLDAPVVAGANEAAGSVKNRGTDGNSALNETLAGFGERDVKHRGVVRFHLYGISHTPPKIMPSINEKAKRDGDGGR